MRNSKDRTRVRQNTEYTASRKHAANLRRNPTLHFQIGLILALLVAIFFMEVKMPTTSFKVDKQDYDWEEAAWDENFQIEKPVVEVPEPVIDEPKIPEPHIPDEFKEVPDHHEIVETVVKGNTEPEVDKPMVDPGKVAYVEPDEPLGTVIWKNVEEVPLFPGCEGLDTNEERKTCMSAKISKFVNKKFDTDIGEELGLSGINRIFVQFTVDKTGAVTNIKSRSPHLGLREEAQRVIELLPEMQPGKQRSVPVGVIYSLPITFQVQD